MGIFFTDTELDHLRRLRREGETKPAWLRNEQQPIYIFGAGFAGWST